tara:strand:- start:37 stop:210 length:174 start_codon:yes stop_codon:yes gene_type:complete
MRSFEPLSLRNKGKQKFTYYLYNEEGVAVKMLARDLGMSPSEVIRKILEEKLGKRKV